MRGHHQHYARQMQQAQQWLAVATTGVDTQLRIGDAERTLVTEALQQHYAEGRLDSDELEERLDATLAAKTQADLREITKDLPGPRSWEAPAPQPMRRHHHHHGPRFLKAPLILLAVFGAIALVTGTPVVFFVALRIMMTLFVVGLLVSFFRRRRFTTR